MTRAGDDASPCGCYRKQNMKNTECNTALEAVRWLQREVEQVLYTAKESGLLDAGMDSLPSFVKRDLLLAQTQVLHNFRSTLPSCFTFWFGPMVIIGFETPDVTVIMLGDWYDNSLNRGRPASRHGHLKNSFGRGSTYLPMSELERGRCQE